jgi:hypothetical protein
MVKFCPNCLYSLGINKKSSLENTDLSVVDKIDEFLNLFTSNKFDKNIYQIGFSKDELIKDKKFNKLPSSEKTKIMQLFQSLIINAELSCNNCGYRSDILETMKLYEFNISDAVNLVRTLDDNKLITQDPTLPRTRDFVCKNVSCPTVNSKSNILKEAVWIRTPKNFNVEYICTSCYYSWT